MWKFPFKSLTCSFLHNVVPNICKATWRSFPPSTCVLPWQADNCSLSLSAAFHLWLKPHFLCRKRSVQTKRSRDAPKGQQACYDWAPTMGKCLKKNTFMQRSMKCSQVVFPWKGKKMRWQNSCLVARTLPLNVWWVKLGWTRAQSLRAENKQRTEPWRGSSAFSRFLRVQNSSLLREQHSLYMSRFINIRQLQEVMTM